MSDIAARVKKIISRHLGLNEADILPENTFRELGADSLDTVEIVMNLETEFDLRIPEEAALGIHTVRDAISYICDALGIE